MRYSKLTSLLFIFLLFGSAFLHAKTTANKTDATLKEYSNVTSPTDLWWTGLSNASTWTDAGNWSTTDPATSVTTAISPPSPATNVWFTADGFPNAQNYTITGAGTINCKDINVVNIGNANKLTLNLTINVYGSLDYLSKADNFFYSGTLAFRSSIAGNTINVADQTSNGNYIFDGIGGEWTFTSGIASARRMYLYNGKVDFGNNEFTIWGLFANQNNAGRGIDYGNSTFILTYNQGGIHNVSGAFDYRLGSPTFIFNHTGGITDYSTSPEVLVYNKILQAYSSSMTIAMNETHTTIDSLINENQGISINFNTTANYVEVTGEYSSNLRNKILTLDELVVNTDCGYHTLYDGTVDFSAAPPTIEQVQLKNVTALVANAAASPLVEVNPGIDNGNNVGFNITSLASRNLYWIGNTGDWHTVTNWSATSGGAPLAITECPPSILDNVFFDANSFNANDQVMTISSTVAYCNNMTWDGLTFSNIDWAGTQSLSLGGDLTLDVNMKEEITFSGGVALIDKVDGILDFKSGAGHRKMLNAPFYSQEQSQYRQISSRVSILSLNMAFNKADRSYDLGGNMDTLYLTKINAPSVIKMEDAIIIATGDSRVIYNGTVDFQFNDNSHIYFTNPGYADLERVNADLPSITQTESSASFNYRIWTGNIMGNLTINGRLNAQIGLNISKTLKLNPEKSHNFRGGQTFTMDSLVSIASSCGTGPVITTSNGTQANINLPNGQANITYATLSNLNYTGDTNPLTFPDNTNINGGNNTNLDFSASSLQVFYWRPSPLDGSYSGNWSSPYHWSLSQTDVQGQNDPLGCIPSAQDSVVFDNLSGDGTSVTVTIDTDESVKSVTWVEGSIPANMNWTMASTGGLNLNGQLTLASNMTTTWDDFSALKLNGSDTTWIDTKGVALNGNIIIDNGVKMMNSTMNGTADLNVRSGKFYGNGNELNFGYIISEIAGTRTINLDSSTVNLTDKIRRNILGDFDLYYPWYLKNVTDLSYSGLQTIFNISATSTSAFMGQGYTYYGVTFENGAVIRGKNTFADSLTFKNSASFYESNTINKLSLKAQAVNTTYTFPANDTTFFLSKGIIEKNGDLNQFINLKSDTNGTLHYFKKPSGGNVFICNINVTDIHSSSVPFKSNNFSTYNGIAGSSSSINFPAGSTWDFNVSAAAPTITMNEANPIHINRGDSTHVSWTISGNDSGPFQIDYTVQNMNFLVTELADGAMTLDSFYVGPTMDTNVQINEIKYYDCPGVYLSGNIAPIASTPIAIPPVNTGLATTGATEDYLLKNLDNYVYIMDGGDRSTTANYNTRNTQVAIKDFVGTADTDSLKMATVTTTIDAVEVSASDSVYLKRHWTFTNSGANTAAKVKFYFSEAELQSMKSTANLFMSDMDFLQILRVQQFNIGDSPVSETGNTQAGISSGIASEVSSTTYFIEAELSSFTGEFYIGTPVPCTIADLAVDGKTTVADQTCDIGNWTYYYNNANPDKALFAIEHNPVGGNTNPFTADILISVTDNPTAPEGIHKVTDAITQEGNFIMGRYWNVNLTSGSLNGPVNIRFYFDQAELANLETEATAFASASTPALEMSQPIWFKTVGSNFHPDSMSATTTNNANIIEFQNPSTGLEDAVDYVQLEGLTSFSGGSVAYRVSTQSSPSLPVELKSFTVASENCDGIIKWTTASEKNFSHFEIEKSSNGVNFRNIATIQANGKSNAQSYSYTDKDLFPRNYYRLKMVDLDGTFHLSHLAYTEKKCGPASFKFDIYPNPIHAGEQLNVKFYTDKSSAKFTIMDLFGRPVQLISLETVKGWNDLNFNISDLVPSNYTLKIEDGVHTETQQFIILR